MSKKFTELNAGTIGAGSIFAQAQEPALSGDPYTSTKVSATQIANYVAKGQAFPELNNQTLIQALTGGSGAGTVILTMAEYLALTPAQQTDGHIYVISDFACLFCYGRQYNALRELTRAQYDQLTPAEKNNGTLYILTDEETTADDIPYSSGVSVADKLDSLSTVETGTFTAGTNIIVLRSSLYKIGNIKFLSVIFRVTDTSASAVGTVSTGFEATYNIDFTAMSDSNSYGRFRIQGNRNSVDISTTPQQNSFYAFTISYI